MRALLLLCLVPLSGCSIFGIATEERIDQVNVKIDKSIENVENRVDQVDAKTTAVTRAIGNSFEPQKPGISRYLEDTLNQYAVDERKGPIPLPLPPPVDTSSWGWLGDIGGPLGTVAAILLAAVAGYKKTKNDAKKEVNEERNEKRIERGEAVTVSEAKAKGYFEDTTLAGTRIDPISGRRVPI